MRAFRIEDLTNEKSYLPGVRDDRGKSHGLRTDKIEDSQTEAESTGSTFIAGADANSG